MIDYKFSRTTDKLRLELRAYGASGGVVFRRLPTQAGAALFVYPERLGGGVSVSCYHLGAGVFAALRPVRWVSWEVWSRTGNHAASRCLSLFGDALGCDWRVWVPMRPMREDRPNTPREGFATWGRVVLGRLRERTVSRRKTPITLTMPEGTYRGEATRKVTEATRTRWPFPKRVTEVFIMLSPVGVSVPADYPEGSIGRLSGKKTREEMTHVSDLDTVKAAVAEFAASLTALRGAWVPPRRFRPKDREETAWEEREPSTGVWKATDVTRATLPAGATVEAFRAPWAGATGALIAMGGLGLIGLIGGMYGAVGAERANAGRR